MSDGRIHTIVGQRTTLGDHAYQSIRDSIITLRLEPGQMVYEAELSSTLGVSRTPVREAFRLLLAEELIEILPQRGIRIAYISRKKVREAGFVRESLETSAFRIVARDWNSSLEQYRLAERQIRGILDDQKLKSGSNDYDGFLESDEAFHRTIIEQSGNATLLAVISIMRAHLNRVRYLQLRQRHHFDVVAEQHARIFNAILENREDETVELLKEHLEYLAYDFPVLIGIYSGYFKE